MKRHEFGAQQTAPPCALKPPKGRRRAISEQEFYAVRVAATPNHFAWLARRMSRHKRQSEPVPDINRSICHDFGAARRDVQYKAFALGHSVVDRNPGRLFAKLSSRFTLYLRPWLINSHDDHPSLDLTAGRLGDRQSWPSD
jgi:hypothetical protein